MIDFHCHLDLYREPAALVADISRLGIHVLSVTTTPSAWAGTHRLAGTSPWIRTSLGLHPQLARERKRELSLFDRLLPAVTYVGEVGLDGSPQFREIWQEQLCVFRHVLNSCHRTAGKILSIHSRRATKEVLDCLDEYPGAGIPIMHWFSGSMRDLDRAIERGCWFSVCPAMLAHPKGRALAARMPSEQVLVETDGPFALLSGRPIHPQDATNAVDGMQELWRTSTDEATAMLRANLAKVWR